MKRILLTMSCVVMALTGFQAVRFVTDGVSETSRQEEQDARTLRSQAVSADPSL